MATSLRDFLAARESEIKEQMKALRFELAEIKIARGALDSAGSTSIAGGSATFGPTIKDMIRAVLGKSPFGLTSLEILTQIERDFGRKLERSSLSPQLSRMKDDSVVSLSGSNWILEAGNRQVGLLAQAAEEGSGRDDDPDIEV